MRSLSTCLILTLLAVFSAQSAKAQTAESEAVLKAREAALIARDGEAVLRLFADNALVVTSSGRIFIGREQIKNWVQDQTERAQREEAGARYQQGAKISWPGKVHREDWKKMGVSPLEVTQDAIVQDGKVRFFSTTFTPDSAARLDAARRRN